MNPLARPLPTAPAVPRGVGAAVRRAAARIDPGVVALLALPWAVLAADPLWVYGTMYRDAWAYFGFFQNLPGHLAAFPDYYTSGRLTALIPGWLAYLVFRPATANLLLHVGVYSVGVLSAYSALASTVGRRAGFLAAAGLGSNYFYQKAVGWDYVDGYAAAYFLLATALAVRAGQPGRWRAWATAAGAAAAAAVVSNPTTVLLLPPVVALFLAVNRGAARHPADAAGFWAGAGFAGLFAVLAVVSRALGGRTLFLFSTLQFMQAISPPPPALFAADPLQWAVRACWLVVPAAAVVGAIVALVVAVRRRNGAVAAVFQGQLLWLAAVLGYGMVRGTFTVAEIWFYADFLLIPATYLALGGQWRDWLAALSHGRFAAVAAGWVAAGVLAGLTADRLHVPGWGAAIPVAAAYACAALAVLVPRVLPAGVGAGVLVAALFGVANVSARAHFRMADSLGANGALIRIDRCQALDPDRKASFAAIAEAARWARTLGPAGRVWYWYDLDAPLGPVYDMVAHADLHHLRILGIRFPDIADGKLYNLAPVQGLAEPGLAVVVLSDDPDAAAKAAHWLNGWFVHEAAAVVVEGERVFGRAPVLVRAVALRVVPAGR